ncbi:MAG: DegV family protein [Dehalococcoidia bacterium]
MAKVALVTDSSSCLPAELLAAHEITVAPLAILFDGEMRQDGTLSGREFYSLLRGVREFPTTASPAPAAFLDAFRDASRRAESVLCVTMSSRFSGTYSSALTAADMARQELPELYVRVIDSRSLAMCHGFAVLAAARAAQAGADIDEAEAVVRDVAARAYLIGVIDTMRYLAKSGRVPLVMHWATSLLQIKPILEARGEEVHAVGRSRTMPRALTRLLSRLGEGMAVERPLRMAVMHADAPERAQEVAVALRDRFQPDELLVTEFTSVMGVHAGPGFVGVALVAGDPAPAMPVGTAASAQGEDVARLEESLGDLPAPAGRPSLVVVAGLPGSGKSHFSRELAQRRPLAHLDSDALRRALFERPTHSAEESARLFAAVHALIERLLARGASVIVDATSARKAHRRLLYEIAKRAGAGLVVVETEAPPDVAIERLTARTRRADPGDASDATVAVYNRMRAAWEPIERPHVRVDTSKDLAPAIEEVLRRLENVGQSVAG